MTRKRIAKTAPLSGISLPTAISDSSMATADVGSPITLLEKQAFDSDGEMLIPALATTLGIAYLEGWFGIGGDTTKGANLLIKAALQGEPTACYKLATLKSPTAGIWEETIRENDKVRRDILQEMKLVNVAPLAIEKLQQELDSFMSLREELDRSRPPYYLMNEDVRAEFLEKARNSGCDGPWFKKTNEIEDLSAYPWCDSEWENIRRWEAELEMQEMDELIWDPYASGPNEEKLRKWANRGEQRAIKALGIRLLRRSDTADEGERILEDLADNDSAVMYLLAERHRRTGGAYFSLMRSSATSGNPYPDALYVYAKSLADPACEIFSPLLAIEYIEKFLALFREGRPWKSIELEHLLIELRLNYCHPTGYLAEEMLGRCLVLRSSRSLLCAGLMRLRGIGCSSDVHAAVRTFKCAAEFPRGEIEDEEQAASTARFLCQLERAGLWDLWAKRLIKKFLAHGKLSMIHVQDVNQLLVHAESRTENAGTFDIWMRLDAAEAKIIERSKIRNTPPAIDVQQVRSSMTENHKNLILGMVCVLSSKEQVKREELLKYWRDVNSPAERFMLAALMAGQAFGKPEYEEAKVAFDQVKKMLECREQRDTTDSQKPDEFEAYLGKRVDSFLAALHPVVTRIREQKAAEEAKKEMLSFLSHTLTNSLTGTSNTLLRIARSLNETDQSSRGKFYRSPAERLISLVANVSFTERLLENFKLYASDPDALKTAWIQDQQGGMPVLRVLALSLRQSLLRFLFAFEHGSDFARLMPGIDRNAFVPKFMDEAMAYDLETDTGTDEFIAWALQNLPCLDLNVDLQLQRHIAPSGPRFIVIFSIIGELFGNALKFSDGQKAIRLAIKETQSGLEVRCTNTCSAASTASVRGGQKGISFMKTICGLVGATLDVSANGEIHEARAWLPHS